MPDLSAASDVLAAARLWLLFGACAAVGTYAQNLIGFASSAPPCCCWPAGG